MKKNGSPTDANVNGCAAQRQKKMARTKTKCTSSDARGVAHDSDRSAICHWKKKKEVIGTSDNGTNDR